LAGQAIAAGGKVLAGQGPANVSGSSAQAIAPAGRPPGPHIRLSLNENAFGCTPLAVEAIRGGLTDLARYTEVDAQTLTAQIAAKEDVLPEQIVLGEVLPALGLQLGLKGGPGGQFIYSQPGFTDLVSAAEQTGGTAVAVPLDDRLQNDLPAIEARVGANTRAVFIVNPHNPSGTLSDNSTLRSFISDVSKRTLIIADEAYLEFTDDFPKRSLVDRVRAGDNVVVFRTFAKIYGLAALQLGYAIAPTALADSLHRQGLGTPHILNRLAVLAASAALRDTAFINETRRKTARERTRWHTALDDLKLHRSDAHGNFVFFESGHDHEALAAAFLAQGIDIGRSFPPLDRWARISIGLPEENKRAIDALRKILGLRSRT
jgi:histidinol-phosphate aminotransferase